ncbi:MAG: MFS family permease [Marivirga sp.]
MNTNLFLFFKLQKLLNLRKGERSTVSLLLLFSFLQYFSLAVLFVTASAIFLTDNSISELPYVFIGTSVSLFILAVIFDQLEKKLSTRSIILAEVILMCVIIVLLRFGFNYQLSWIGYGLIIGHRVMSDYIDDGFNRLVLMLLDVRQSKRLYGLVTSAEIPANILGYLTATLLIPFMGTIDLLWISTVGLLISLFVLFVIVSGRHRDAISKFDLETLEASETISTKENKSLFYKIFRTRFIFLLSITISFSVISFIFIEFAFLNKVDAEMTNQKDIVRFISIVFGAGQFIAFFFKTFLYGLIQRKYGTRFNLLILPVTLGVICLLVILESLLPNSSSLLIFSWIFIMLISDILNSSIYKTTFISLLQPMDRKMKMIGYKIMNNIEIIAIGLGGVILLFTYSEGSNDLLHYSYLLLGGVIAWIICIPYLNKSYLSTLENVLSKRFIESAALEINTPQTIHIIQEKLKSRHPGEVIYAMDVLCKDDPTNNQQLLTNLITHPVNEVRKEVYKRIIDFKVMGMREVVRDRIANDPDAGIKKLAVQTYCFLGEANITEEIIPYLDDADRQIQTGAVVGLISYGGINGIIAGGQRLLEFINSDNPDQREFGAYVIGEVGIHNFYRPILKLLNDEQQNVKRSAIKAAGKINHPKLYDTLVELVANPNLFEPAMNALIRSGENILNTIEPVIKNTEGDPKLIRRLVTIIGRTSSPKGAELLKDKIYTSNIEIRDQVLQSCAALNYVPNVEDKSNILQTIHSEMADATWFLKCIQALQHTDRWMHQSNFDLLITALNIELKHISKRVLYLLSFLYESKEIAQVWERLQLKDKNKIANALEIVDVLVSQELTSVVLPLLENYPISQQLKILKNRYPIADFPLDKFLQGLITGEGCPTIIPWTRLVAIYSVQQIRIPTLIEKVAYISREEKQIYAETALYILARINLISEDDNGQENILSVSKEAKEKINMSANLLTIEKVMALKTTAIFKETAEDLLFDIAAILQEISYSEGTEIVKKDEIGTCMYIIYSGSVYVHDGDIKLAELKEGNFFGELALLDAEPRSASVTALEDSLLLRIDQEAFYEIMADRSEVIRGIMKILCERLRNQNSEVARLRESLNTKNN